MRRINISCRMHSFTICVYFLFIQGVQCPSGQVCESRDVEQCQDSYVFGLCYQKPVCMEQTRKYRARCITIHLDLVMGNIYIRINTLKIQCRCMYTCTCRYLYMYGNSMQVHLHVWIIQCRYMYMYGNSK